jgi:hypothetical protein
MVTDISIWRKRACDILRIVVDEQFQRENWFGRGKYISSPEEIYNELFTDLEVEVFIASPGVALNEQQKKAGNDLVAKLEAFDKEVGPELPPDVVIDHPKWSEIRQAAKKFRELLDCRD